MQVTPEAAKDIARHSGATTFHTEDLSNPEINIKYGTFLLAERIDSLRRQRGGGPRLLQRRPGHAEKWGGDRA